MKQLVLFLSLLLVLPAQAKNTNQKLVDAVLDGDTPLVTSLLKAGADPNQTVGDESLLACAAERGFADVLNRLLDSNVDMDHTALTKAVDNRRICAARTLVEFGSALNKAGGKHSPLTAAVKKGDHALVHLLLEAGAEVDARDKRGNTALMIAARSWDQPIAETLLEYGAEINAQNQAGATPLLQAVKRTKLEMVSFLLGKGADMSIADKLGNHPMMFVKLLNHEDLFHVFQSHAQGKTLTNAGVTNRPDTGSALVNAARSGDLVEVERLLAAGADINERGKAGETALIMAAVNGRSQVVRQLTRHGAELDAVDKAGRTALGRVGSDELLAKDLIRAGARLLAIQDGKPIRIKSTKMKAWRKAAKKLTYAGAHYPSMPFLSMPSADVARVGEAGVTSPQFTFRKAPVFPKAGISAMTNNKVTKPRVILRTILGADGSIGSIDVLQGVDDWAYNFEYEAVNALKQWRFQPGTRDGKPIDVRMTLVLEFKLEGANPWIR